MKNHCQSKTILDAVVINKLKKKIIEEYNNYIKSLSKGYKNDYSNLLNEINFIEIYQNLDNQKSIYEYFINYDM